MTKPNLIRLIDAFLLQGFTVVYVDFDDHRREEIQKWADLAWTDFTKQDSNLAIWSPTLKGLFTLHYHVLITVNEKVFDPVVLKELNNVPGYFDGKAPCIVRIEL